MLKLEKMEKKITGQDKKIQMIFDYLKQFIKEQVKPKESIGFKQK